MATYNFYRTEELKDSKKEKRIPNPSFAISSDHKSIMSYIRKYDLEENFVWIEI